MNCDSPAETVLDRIRTRLPQKELRVRGFPESGGGGGRGWGGGGGQLTFWELSKHTWIDIHDWVAVALTLLIIIHVILHWKWIVRMAKSLFRGASQKLTLSPSRT